MKKIALTALAATALFAGIGSQAFAAYQAPNGQQVTYTNSGAIKVTPPGFSTGPIMIDLVTHKPVPVRPPVMLPVPVKPVQSPVVLPVKPVFPGFPIWQTGPIHTFPVGLPGPVKGPFQPR